MKETILPVALCDDKSHYIEIENADKDKTYYCPCCGGIVYPKATNSKFISAHFCHKQNTCSGESITHFLKKWGYTKNHSISEIGLDYDYADIEPEYKTSVGIYKPDVALHLSNGSVVFLEIKNTNGKSFDYILKWNEIGYDVIEFDIHTGEYNYLFKDCQCICKHKNRPKEKSQIEILEYAQNNSITKGRYSDLAMFWKKCREYTQDCDIADIKALIIRMPQDDIVFIVKQLKKYHCSENLLDRIRPTVFESIKQGYIADCKSHEFNNSFQFLLKNRETICINNHWYNLFDYCDYYMSILIIKYYSILKSFGLAYLKQFREYDEDGYKKFEYAKSIRDFVDLVAPNHEVLQFLESTIFGENLFEKSVYDEIANGYNISELGKGILRSILSLQQSKTYDYGCLKEFVSCEKNADNSFNNIQDCIITLLKYEDMHDKIEYIKCLLKKLYLSGGEIGTD